MAAFSGWRWGNGGAVTEEHWSIKNIRNEADRAQAEIDRLKQHIVDLSSALGKLKPYEAIEWYSSKATRHEQWEATYQADLERCRRNAEVMRHNADLVNALIAQITAAGFKTAVQKKARSYRSLPTTVDAPWIASLRECMPVPPPNEQKLTQDWEHYQRQQAEAQRAEEQKAREAERARQDDERRVKCIALAVKAGMDPLQCRDVDDLLRFIAAQDKYLNLAHAGVMTRNNWSDGPWAVEQALADFRAENATDRDIVDEWQHIVDEFEDGRAFRDCDWNYNHVMELADPSLLALYREANDIA